MDSNLITVEILINGVLFKPMLIDISCECYFIVDKDLVTELRLPRIKIPLKLITGFIKENIKEPWVEIMEIAKFSIDIQGYWWNTFTYVVPVLLNFVIIGLLWMRKDDVIIKPVINTLIINSYGLMIFDKNDTSIIEDKGINGNPVYNIGKRGQEMLKTAYDI